MGMSEQEIFDAESWIIKICKELIKEDRKQNGYIKTWVAIVDSYDSINNTADVYLPNSPTKIIESIKNNSRSSTLTNGDIVELHSRLGVLGSSTIEVKY